MTTHESDLSARATSPAESRSSPNRLKISLFIRSLMTGGSQRQLAILANELARRAHDVTVIVLYPGGGIASELGAGIRVLSLEKAGRWDTLGPFARLRRHLRAERPDVLYTFQPVQSVIAALLLPRGQATRLVFGIRGGRMEFAHYDILSAAAHRLEPWLARRADLVIANGHAVRDDAIARGFPPHRTIVISNGIDTGRMRPDEAAGRRLRHEWGIADGEFVVGMVARLDPMKDHATFLAAAAQFSVNNSDARFVCVGTGPPTYREKLKAMAQMLGLDTRIIWAGEMRQVSAAYNAFDLVTLTSAFGEGFPNVVAEAMACGRPVVATDVGETAFVLKEHDEAVPPRQPELLSAAWARMRRLLATDSTGLSAAARRHVVENFSVDRMVDRSESAFLELCAAAPSGSRASRDRHD